MKRTEEIKGPCINTKDDAMKTLGIEKKYIGHSTGGVSVKVCFELHTISATHIQFFRFPFHHILRKILLKLSGKSLKCQVGEYLIICSISKSL